MRRAAHQENMHTILQPPVCVCSWAYLAYGICACTMSDELVSQPAAICAITRLYLVPETVLQESLNIGKILSQAPVVACFDMKLFPCSLTYNFLETIF